MKKSVIIILHLGYWALFLILLVIIFVAALAGQPALDTAANLQNIYVTVCFVVIPGVSCFYGFYTFLFSHFLYRKKILALFIYGILFAIICGLAGCLAAMAVFGYKIMFGDGWESVFELTLLTALVAILNGGMGLVMKGFITWYAEIKLKEDLSRKNYEMELALVKSRINPHFLFNTINNIDVLIEKDPVKASAYLNKLSDIMRFMLYETKAENISLNRELEYIEKFVALQKIRTANTDFVQYSIEGNPANRMVAPMLFIPFIENAFKHAENKITGNAVNIKFVIDKNQVIFYCENSYHKNNHTKADDSGLGNELIEKRLALLYGDKHTLEITNENEMYKVKLILNNHESELHHN